MAPNAKRKQDGKIGNAMKCKKLSNDEQYHFKNSNNIMEEMFLRFPHIAENIFQNLDNQGLTKCRCIDQSWQNFIDQKKYPWMRIVQIPTIPANGNSYFHLAAKTGQGSIFETIFDEEKDKNPRNDNGFTPFHLAAKHGCLRICQMIVRKFKNNNNENEIRTFFEMDFNFKAFHLACQNGHSEIAEFLLQNSAFLKINLNEKDEVGWTAFHMACWNGHSELAELLMKNSGDLNIDLKR